MYIKIYVCIYSFSTLYLVHNEHDGIISSLKLSVYVRTGLRKDIPNEKVKKTSWTFVKQDNSAPL